MHKSTVIKGQELDRQRLYVSLFHSRENLITGE